MRNTLVWRKVEKQKGFQYLDKSILQYPDTIKKGINFKFFENHCAQANERTPILNGRMCVRP